MGRAPCCDKSGLKKGPWTAEEDRKLVDYIQKHGHGSWRALPEKAGLPRCGKSCRLRWTNYLRPDIKRGRFSFEEEETIIQLHRVLGNKWSAIATRLPGRTDNEIKNYWNTHIRKRLIRMGIDPVTHTSTHSDLSSLFSPSSNLYSNPAAAAAVLLNLYGLLGLQPATELIKIATNLLSFQCQSSGVVDQEAQLYLPADTAQAFQSQKLRDPAQDEAVFHPTAINAPNNAHDWLLDEELVAHMGADNEGQIRLQQDAQTEALWLDVVSQYSNMSDNDHLMISTDNLDPFLPQIFTESSCFDRTNNLQNCNFTSGSSTPASSSNNINSPLTNIGVEGVEGDISCSRSLFEFQYPHLLDISDDYT